MSRYTYLPEKIKDGGKDKMRFELGDTDVCGGAETCALCDEEYEAILEMHPGKTRWKKAKFELVKSIMHRFSYEVDTKVDSLSLSLRQRFETWESIYNQLRNELNNQSVPRANPVAISSKHYFHENMHDNFEAGGTEGGGRLVP